MALEQCCFCCKLDNGAFIWGVLSSVINFILFGISHNDNFVALIHMRGLSNEWLVMFRMTLIIYIIASVLLAFGAIKKNHHLMLPWIVVQGISLIPFLPIAFIVCLLAAPLAFPFYIWWCMCSAYQKVQDDKQPTTDGIRILTSNHPSQGIGYSSPPYVSMHQSPPPPPRYSFV